MSEYLKTLSYFFSRAGRHFDNMDLKIYVIDVVKMTCRPHQALLFTLVHDIAKRKHTQYIQRNDNKTS